MKSKIISIDGKEKGSIELPKMVSSEIRKDVVARVFESQKRETPYGPMNYAGRGHSASGILRRKRHAWKATYGKGIARSPRKIMSRHGVSFQWVGATAPYARGGGRAHGHNPNEVQFRKVNKTELRIALGSAIAGTFDAKYAEKKYSLKVSNSAYVVDDSVVKAKTSDFIEFLQKAFGNASEKLLKVKTVRAGQGKARGRKYKSNAGLLFVVSSDEKMNKSGVDVVKAKELQISDLAPNGQPGRFAIYSEKAIKEISEVWK